MAPKFNIQLQDINADTHTLTVQVSFCNISFITISQQNTINSLLSYDFAANTNEEEFIAAINDIFTNVYLLKRNFLRVNMVIAFPTAILAPYQYHNSTADKGMFELVYGENKNSILKTDLKFKRDLCTIYQVPIILNTIITTKFPQANFTHLYSLLPDILQTNGNHLYTIFGTNDLTIMLLKAGKLQIIQNFKYKTADDITYYLLSVCENFEIDINETALHLSGMIEKKSTLYKDIQRYFLQIQFEDLPIFFNYTDEIKSFPPHFFSHLFATAACV